MKRSTPFYSVPFSVYLPFTQFSLDNSQQKSSRTIIFLFSTRKIQRKLFCDSSATECNVAAHWAAKVRASNSVANTDPRVAERERWWWRKLRVEIDWNSFYSYKSQASMKQRTMSFSTCDGAYSRAWQDAGWNTNNGLFVCLHVTRCFLLVFWCQILFRWSLRSAQARITNTHTPTLFVVRRA